MPPVLTELESQEREFSISADCLLCGEQVHHKKNDHHVKTSTFRETLCKTIEERRDKWSAEVDLRIQKELDLVTAGAVYHGQCHVNFLTFRNVRNAQDATVKKGAPINQKLHDAFLQLVDFLETSEEPYSTSELSEKFEQFSGGEMYSLRYLKDKLVKHFGDRIMFLNRNGLSDVVIMREVNERIIINLYEESKRKPSQGKMETAADVVLSEIKSIKTNKDSYPLPSEISSLDHGLSFIPQSLLSFLTRLFGQCKTDQTTKIIAIGHAIIQTCRPRCLLSPIQLGLGIQVSVLTASRLLNMLTYGPRTHANSRRFSIHFVLVKVFG